MKLSLEPRETGNLCRVASEPLEYWKGCWHWATEYVGLSVGLSTEISLWATAGHVCWETQCLGVAAPSNSLSKLIAKNLLCNSQLFVILKKRFFFLRRVLSVGVIKCQNKSSTKWWWWRVYKEPNFQPIYLPCFWLLNLMVLVLLFLLSYIPQRSFSSFFILWSQVNVGFIA